jgi:hypothetical protein
MVGKKTIQTTYNDNSQTVGIDLNLEKDLFIWEAPERTFQERDRDFWVTAISILVLISVILIFIKEFFLIVALFSVLFLYYVLSTVKPGTVKCKLTTRGVYFGDVKYEWDDLSRFWFKKTLSYEVMTIQTKLNFPRQIAMVINSKDMDKISQIVVKRVPLLESSPSFVDKTAKWAAEKLPLESRKK